MPQQLLAKSPRWDGKKLTLEQHLLDTEEAALCIFKERILENWCRFFQVDDAAKFLTHLRVAALFHDIGKANAEFYAAVTGSRAIQTLRHEWFSALILHLPSVRTWLECSRLELAEPSRLDLEVITAAVLSHHLKASYEAWGKPRTQVKQVELYLNYPEVREILGRIAEVADVEGLPELPAKWVAEDNDWEQVYQEANKIGRQFSRKLKRDEHRRSLLLAVKAGVIAADSAASGLFRQGYSIQQWIDDTLHTAPITPEEIETKILQPRYRQIEEKSGQPFELKSFQRKALELSDRILLLSGCGTGKTIFGYKWEQSVLTRYQVGHIIFLYPTRGTAKEGFKDYVSWAPEADASLLTGTAAYELMEMAKNPDDSTQGKDFTTEERLFALGFWGKRFFSATVDQFLSFLTHNYSSLCLLPVLADAVVVIDEVHSFSRSMFDNLISFLEHFDIPVLCMTATLPKTRRLELERVGLQVFSTVTDEELEKVETHPRYHVQTTDSDTAYAQAIEAYNHGNRVLWVVNTVKQCREIAAKLEPNLGVEVLTYHSRFRLQDRQKQHQKTVDAFAYQKDQRQPAIAVTTQVCEMSLDLDADVLITELAPISALVQRFGRSNRHLSHGPDFLAQIFVYKPAKVSPYKTEELDKARDFLAEVSGAVSQWQLAEKLEHHSLAERFSDGRSSFVAGGYWATSESFRDTNNYSVNALLDTDLDVVKKLVEQNQPYDGYLVPIPKQSTMTKDRPDWLPRYLEIADHHYYSTSRGFGK